MSMTRRDSIAEAILASRALFSRYLVGFDDSNHTRQAPNLPNHVAWCLGHCALTLHRGVERINEEPPPDADFYIPQVDATRPSVGKATPLSGRSAPNRFDAETVAFQSVPVDNPMVYPKFDRCVEIFNGACERYAGIVRTLPESRLDDMIRWGQIDIPIWASGLRLSFHNGTHCGQVADLRRALGMRSIFA